MEIPEGADLGDLLLVFNQKNHSSKESVHFDPKLKAQTWKTLKEAVEEKTLDDNVEIFKALKILSREKSGLEELVDESIIDILLEHGVSSESLRIQTESLSVLSNLLLQCRKTSSFFDRKARLKILLMKAKSFEREEDCVPLQLLLRDLFLITAFHPSCRIILMSECEGVTIIQDLFAHVLSKGEQNNLLNEREADIIIEITKLLFNISLGSKDLQEDLHFERTAELVKRAFKVVSVKNEDIIKHCTNLLSNAPLDRTGVLIEMSKGDETIFNDHSMVIPKAILDQLLKQLDNSSPCEESDIASVPLLVLCQLSRQHRDVRKFLRRVVLPPLKDMKNPPEVGDTPRNKLCKLMTSPDTGVSSLCSEFLFILCKESVTRMVKHTGYGNAAGLLARRGLLTGKPSEKSDEFSEESEDSETEEYAENAHKLNLITGCIEERQPQSPFEGMSDERKEYEAMELVGLLDKLNKVGLIRPCVPGSDGKPVPVEHIAQLTEHIQINETQSSDDGY